MQLKRGVSSKLSKNFLSTEFDCKGIGCCKTTVIDKVLVKYLQQIRDYFGSAVIITSGYRCKEHNKTVKGASKSNHLYGKAADIKVKGVEPIEVARLAEKLGILGIGLYESDEDGFFVHIDTRNKKSFWYGKREEKRESFIGIKISKRVKEWQLAAIADGFKFKSGADGIWGNECATVAKKAVCKKRIVYRYKNLTKIIQKKVGVTPDGKYGAKTKAAVINFQSMNGLTVDGEVGIKTWIKILGVI